MARSNNNDAVKMDSRKFLSALNDSAQAKVSFFEERVQQMGRSAGREWRLAALHARNLFIEDVQTHQYYQADHVREQHGRVTISNIRPIKIVEEEKKSIFSETCVKLVNAIEENDQKGMQVAFDRMKAQRFSSRAIPNSGVVKCRDGVVRHVTVSSEDVSLAEDSKNKLVATIVESLRDKVIVENGTVVSGRFSDGAPLNLPVTKWAGRKLVARKMMEAAKNAYWSNGFQSRVLEISQFIAEGKVETAVKTIAPFLNEMEEFTLLNRAQVQTLVENALAAKAVFNQQLCEDTATLIFRTNMKISRNKIIDEWRNIARKAEHPVLAENVAILEESNNFESSYQKFLKLIFETISNRDVAAEALATTLGALKDKTPKIKESHDLSSKLNSLIVRLKNRNPDDAAIYEAEDLIATIQEELAAADSLQNFDQIPSPAGSDLDLGGSMGGPAGAITGASAGGSGAPVININSPLIQIGGTSSAAGESGAVPTPGAVPEMEAPLPGGDEDLDALLGAPEGAPAQGAPAAPAAPVPGTPPAAAPAPAAAPGAAPAPILQSRERRGNVLGESRPITGQNKKSPVRFMSDKRKHKASTSDHADSAATTHEESADPYAYNAVVNEKLHITDYGAPVITDDGDVDRIVRIMQRLAVENKLTGASLEHNLPAMAKASIKAVGLRIPESKMGYALEQVIGTFLESTDKIPPQVLAKFKSDDEDEEDGGHEGEDEGVAEDQYKMPKIRRRGLGRSSINPSKKQRSTQSVEESRIVWKQKQDDALLGSFKGVRFILDHGGGVADLPPIVMSEDGSVEIPIPTKICESALAAANLVKGDSSQFVNWLSGSIEQLRPIAEGEDLALNEAMAKITTSADGEIEVEVDGDVTIGNPEEENTEVILGDEVTEPEMAPVDSLSVGGKVETDQESEESEDEMPDFESASPFKKETMSDEEESEDEESEDEESEDEESEDEESEDEESEDEESEDEESEDEESEDEESEDEESEDEESEEEESEDEGEEGLAEDHEVTDPSSAKYTKHVKDNYREIPKHKLTDDADDELQDIGPDVEEDDGTGTNPPTARRS